MFIFLGHHKCATTWLQKFLDAYCMENGLRGKFTIYSTVQPYSGEHILAHLNSEYFLYDAYKGHSLLHIIRDPRDIIVSAYYSHRNTHPKRPWLKRQRVLLRAMGKDAGMIATWLFLEKEKFVRNTPGTLYSLRHWNWNDDLMTVRTEDIATNMEKIGDQFGEFFGHDVRHILDDFTFKSLSGRAVGDVDNNSHYRSGLPGQWKKDMRPELAEAVYHNFSEMIDRFYD